MKPPPSPSSARALLPSPPIFLCLVSVALVAVVYLVAFPGDLKLQEVFSSLPCSNRAVAGRSATPATVDFRLFLGVLTRPEYYERRALLRLAYSLQPPPRNAVIDVRFVLCRLDKEEDRVLVSLEAAAYGDVVVLNCTENMNDGKTHKYFSTLPRLLAGDGDNPAYDYVGKTDDDAYYRLATLADSLRGKARREMYHGFLFPCDIPREYQFMAGFGYIVSWDIAEWIAATPELWEDGRDKGRPEDILFGEWLHKGGKFKNVYGERPRMYDYMDAEMHVNLTCCRHELRADPGTVTIHKLKDRLKWARTLRFFNATQGLKPSKMFPVEL
ncbi:hypothetical protein ACP4OV_000808 [Aristida adscensionis]